MSSLSVPPPPPTHPHLTPTRRSATYMSIPPVLNQEQQFTAWMACFHTLMMKPLPLVGAGSSAPPRPSRRSRSRPACTQPLSPAAATAVLLDAPGGELPLPVALEHWRATFA